jgi:hypothetical protein
LKPTEGEASLECTSKGAWQFLSIQREEQRLWEEATGAPEPPRVPVNETTAVGRLLLHRFNGTEEYLLSRAVIFAVKETRGLRLWFEVEAGPPVRTLPDTVELGTQPGAEVGFPLSRLNASELVNRTFELANGYDQRHGALAALSYVEQQELRETVVHIGDREGSTFHVCWTAVTTEVNHYDGSKPDTRVEIERRFTFEDLDEWEERP